MLTNLTQQPGDALLALIKLHNADPRADKIDLGVGVYKTGQGDTPVFAAIKEAEFDQQMGKLTEEDYRILREKYEARALEALAELDRLRVPGEGQGRR